MNPMQGKLLCEIRESENFGLDLFVLCAQCEWTMITFDDLLPSAIQSWLVHVYSKHSEGE